MKGWLVDTDVLAELCGATPDAKVKKWIEWQPESRLYLSVLTLAEYQRSIHSMEFGHARRPVLERAVMALEKRFEGRILSLTDAIVLRWGEMSGTARQGKGFAPPMMLGLQAATAMEHGLYLATHEAERMVYAGVQAFDPWKDDVRKFPVG